VAVEIFETEALRHALTDEVLESRETAVTIFDIGEIRREGLPIDLELAGRRQVVSVDSLRKRRAIRVDDCCRHQPYGDTRRSRSLRTKARDGVARRLVLEAERGSSPNVPRKR
jgi:hypothetical protein